jgi:plastocyanin
VSPKDGRQGLSTTVLAILVVIVIVIGGAIGIYYPKPAQKASIARTTAMSSTSTTSTASPSITTASSSAAATSSITSRSVGSNTTSYPPAASPLFNFTLTSGPATILMLPGSTIIYAYAIVTPLPSAAEGQAAALEFGVGDELVVLNATEPSGISLHFFGSNLTSSTLYDEVDAGFPTNLELQLTAAPSMAPGVYPITIDASSGTLSVNCSFTVQVVKNLVTINNRIFSPSNLNVTVGSTVYWMDVSSDATYGAYNVVFNTINVQSPVLNPCVLADGPGACSIFSYTFTTAGTFSYICNIYSGMKGTITVTG